MKGKLGYASAAVGDAACYMFINTFLLFFLTTVAGIEPAAAGTITIIGAFWNALVNPIIGYISDNLATKWGKRRPFIIVMTVPLVASIFLLFTAVDVLPLIRPIYYGAMTMIFWTAYTGFFVPYLALGAEYTTDYNERTELRSYASIFNMIGTLMAVFAIGTCTLIIGKLMDVNTIPELCIFVVIISIAPNIYWQLMPAIIYDVCEYDELETGKQRQGAIVSLLSLVEAFAAGLGSQLLGIILQFAGFDGSAAVQSETALVWVENSMTIVPAIFIVMALTALKKYPITKQRFQEIQAELARRKGEYK